MFRLAKQTVEELFKSQQPRLQGKLRLDVSSHVYPADARKPLDVAAAEEALGERFLRLLGDLAEQAVVENPNQRNVLVMPDDRHFDRPVVEGIIEDCGLYVDSQHFRPAMDCLARDFRDWAAGSREERARYGIEIRDPEIYILCEDFPKEVDDLPSTSRVDSGRDLLDWLNS